MIVDKSQFEQVGRQLQTAQIFSFSISLPENILITQIITITIILTNTKIKGITKML